MSQPTPPQPRLDVRGAVDLSGLGRTPAPAPGGPGAQAAAGSGVVVDVVSQADLQAAVQQSLQVPVVFAMWASWSEASQSVTAELARLADEFDGRLLVARVDVEGAPQVAQAFQVQAVPTVVAVLRGQPLPLFQGQASGEEIRAVVDQLLQAAAANGVTGRVEVTDRAAQEGAEAKEPPLPPLHQEAYDAIERDDLDGAVAAYERALAENPRDELAQAGLAQVRLLQRTREVDPAAARAAAAADPKDVDAALVVADLDVLGGNVEDAFGRLVDLVRVTAGDDRERVRLRLIELFGVVGDGDPRVSAARRALAAALF